MIKLKVNKVDDRLINKYLESRNLKFNRSKMINNKIIATNSHYIWWFNNTRSKYFISPKKNKLIFFWQKAIKFRNRNFLVGGWHSNIEKVNIYYILYILKWQLNFNKRKKIKYDWIAVVKKNNNWVFKIIKYLGYEIISDRKSFHYKAIKKIFDVDENKFYFLKMKIT